MNTSRLKKLSLASLLVLLALATFFALRPSNPSATSAAQTATPVANTKGADRPRETAAKPSGAAVGSPDREKMSEEAPPALPDRTLLAEIENALHALRAEGLRESDAMHILAALRERILNAPPSEAAAAIVAFLDRGEDAATTLDFVVLDGGALGTAPTLRTALLDLLGRIEPLEASAYSDKIFARGDSPDEWALALRNLAWQSELPEVRAKMEARFAQMLDQSEWLGQPTAGYLEAFDIAVKLGGAEQIINMASVIGAENKNLASGVEWAAFVAIDRLFVSDPGTGFALLSEDPELLSWSPSKRSALMSRADVTDPVQRRTVEGYLSNPALSADELDGFLSQFPNRNYFEGHRLTSLPETTPSMQEVAANDLATLEVVNQWMADGRFTGIQDKLQNVQARLEEFSRQIAEQE